MQSTNSSLPAPSLACAACGGAFALSEVTLTLRRSESHFIVLRGVPAEVCEECGEERFTVPTSLALIAAVQTDRQPDDIALLPIYDFALPR